MPAALDYMNIPQIQAFHDNGRVDLFFCWDYDTLRKAIDSVGKVNTTDLRAAVEDAVKRTCRRLRLDIDDKVVEHFFLHQKQLSLTKYLIEGSEAIGGLLWNLTEPQGDYQMDLQSEDL